VDLRGRQLQETEGNRMRSFIICSRHIIMKDDEMCRACVSRMETDKKSSYRAMTVKPERKRQLGICKRRWEDNIKVVVKNVRMCDRFIWFR
jgi:hypothetical protein